MPAGGEFVRVVHVGAAFTICGVALPALLAHPEAPVKVAVIVWLPTLRAVVLTDAGPALFTGTFDAHTVIPSAKDPVPDGMPAPEVVVDVKITDWPENDGLGDEITVVAVATA
jgi:hypothetical protein